MECAFPLHAPSGSSRQLCLALFKEVKSIGGLMDMHPSTLCLIDAGSVLTSYQVRVGAATAAMRQEKKCMLTQDIHTELLVALSATRRIKKAEEDMLFSLKKGSDLLVAAIDMAPDGFAKALTEVQGDRVSLGCLEEAGAENKEQRLRKLFKLRPTEVQGFPLEASIIHHMACKDK